MPKLLVFAPCERVIVSQDENNPTLISILTTIGGEIERPESQAIEKNALGPMRWSIFALWQKQSTDEGKTFKQKVCLVSPSNRVAFNADHEFTLTVDTHRVIINLGMIPIADNGDWDVQLFLSEKGAAEPQTPLASFPLAINFAIIAPADGKK